MGFWSGVGDFISSVASKASSFLSVATSVVPKLAIKILDVIITIAKIIEAVAIVFDVMKPNEKIEDLGERVLQANEKGITLESCGNDFEKYQNEIREISIDLEIALKRPKEAQYAAGIGFVQTGIEQKAPFLHMDSLYSLFALKSDFFTEERMKSYVQTALLTGYGMDKLKGYLDGTCPLGDKKNAEMFLQTAELKFNPSFDPKIFSQEIAEVKGAAQR